MTDPIRILSRARNNRLMEIREQLGMGVREFAEYVGISYGHYNSIENLTIYPSNQIIERLIAKLGSSAEEAFPDYLKEIRTNKSEYTIPEAEVLQLSAIPPHQLLTTSIALEGKEFKERLDQLLAMLSPRSEQIIRMRFGLDGPKQTLEEVAAHFALSRDRIRQIEKRALRKLSHPANKGRLLGIDPKVESWKDGVENIPWGEL
jgi:RNA polymerase sigma factor (sigma-70 family)